jgi:hypothetical protein
MKKNWIIKSPKYYLFMINIEDMIFIHENKKKNCIVILCINILDEEKIKINELMSGMKTIEGKRLYSDDLIKKNLQIYYS